MSESSQDLQFDNSLEDIRSRHSQELVIALCGAVGAGVKRLKTALISELERAHYHVEHIRLSDLIAYTQENPEKILNLKRYERYKTLQDLGDELRKKSSTTIADMGIRRIGILRNTLFGTKGNKGEQR